MSRINRRKIRLTESTKHAQPATFNEAAFVLGEAADPTGAEWDVILIEVGLSKNGNRYPASTLRESVALFEGAAVFADHPTDQERRVKPERSIRDKVGKLVDVQFGQFDTGQRVVEGLKARFKVMVPWLRETLLEAHKLGEPDFLGFSINAVGEITQTNESGRGISVVERITRVESVDVVTDPAAGGQIVRLAAASRGKGSDMDFLKAAIEAAKKPDPSITDDMVKTMVEAASEARGDDVDEAAIVEAVATATTKRVAIAEAGKAAMQAAAADLLDDPSGDEGESGDEAKTKAELVPAAGRPSLSDAEKALLEGARTSANAIRVDKAVDNSKLSPAGVKLVAGRLNEALTRRDLTD